MRYLMTSFLAMHWAVFFALLAYSCIDGGGPDAALALFKAGGLHDMVQPDLATAPIAVAFLLVAALFCWVFVEACLGESDLSDTIVKLAFVAAGVVFSAFLIGGVLGGAAPSRSVLYFGALMASYLAVLGERRTAFSTRRAMRDEARATVRAMARGAADTSLLGRISGRPDLGRGR
jgi:hypothetical protein